MPSWHVFVCTHGSPWKSPSVGWGRPHSFGRASPRARNWHRPHPTLLLILVHPHPQLPLRRWSIEAMLCCKTALCNLRELRIPGATCPPMEEQGRWGWLGCGAMVLVRSCGYGDELHLQSRNGVRTTLSPQSVRVVTRAKALADHGPAWHVACVMVNTFKTQQSLSRIRTTWSLAAH